MKRSPLAVVFLTIFIDLVSFGIVIPLLPFYAKHFGASGTVVGFLLSVFSLMSFIMMPVWGRLSDRYGRRPILLMTLAVSVVAYIIFSLSTELWMLFLSRILSGIGNANISVVQAYISDITAPENRAKGMGMIGAAFGLGFVFGPLIGGVFSADYFGAWKYALPSIIATGLSIMNFILAYLLLPESLTVKEIAGDKPMWDFGHWKQILKSDLRWLILLFFIVTGAFSSIYATFPLYILESPFSLTSTGAGMFFVEIGVVTVIIQGGLIGKLSKLFGEKRLVFAGSILMALGFLGLPLSALAPGINLFFLAMATGFIALGASFFTPSIMSLTSMAADPGQQGIILGVAQSIGSLGRMLGPSGGGAAYDLIGHASPFYMAFVVMLVAIVMSHSLLRKLTA